MLCIIFLCLILSSSSSKNSSAFNISQNCYYNQTYPSIVNASNPIARLYYHLLVKEPVLQCKTLGHSVSSNVGSTVGNGGNNDSGQSNPTLSSMDGKTVDNTVPSDRPKDGNTKDDGLPSSRPTPSSKEGNTLPSKDGNTKDDGLPSSRPTPTSLLDEKITNQGNPDPNVYNGKNVYVSSSKGSDSGDGSLQKPLLDLEKALKQAKSGDKFYLRSGDIFSGIFSITSDKIWIGSYADDGSKDKPLLTRAQLVKESKKTSRNGNIDIYDVSNLMGSYNSIWGVWINGFRYTIARYPNLQDPKDKRGAKLSEFILIRAIGTSKDIKPVLNMKNLKSSSYWKGATLRIRSNHWAYDRAKILSVDSANSVLQMNRAIPLKHLSGFFLENVAQELDAPGEYWYDSTKKNLHIYTCSGSNCPPSADKNDGGIWILPLGDSCQERLSRACGRVEEDYKVAGSTSRPSIISIKGNQVELSGIKISKGYTGVEIYGQKSRILNCDFDLLLETAIHVYPSGSVLVKSCLIQNIDIDGISNDNEKNAISTISGTVIIADDCIFKNIALVAGYNYQGFGVTCHLCEIKNSKFLQMGYGAIQLWTDGYAHDNFIQDWQMTLCDTGALYSVLRTSKSRMENNRITGSNFQNGVSANWEGHGLGAAIYLDQASTDMILKGNIIEAKTSYCIRINSSRRINIENNQCKSGGIYIQNVQDHQLNYGIPENIIVQGNLFTKSEKYILSIISDMNVALIPKMAKDIKNNKFVGLANCKYPEKNFKVKDEYQIIKSQNTMTCG